MWALGWTCGGLLFLISSICLFWQVGLGLGVGRGAPRGAGGWRMAGAERLSSVPGGPSAGTCCTFRCSSRANVTCRRPCLCCPRTGGISTTRCPRAACRPPFPRTRREPPKGKGRQKGVKRRKRGRMKIRGTPGGTPQYRLACGRVAASFLRIAGAGDLCARACDHVCVHAQVCGHACDRTCARACV